MHDPAKDLIMASEVKAYVESQGKTWPWFHNLGIRYKLLPPPVIRHATRGEKPSKDLPEHINKMLKKLQGRKVLYPKGTLEYLGLIIKLRKRLSFSKIKQNEEVLKELKKLSILSETSLYVSPLVKDEGFYINFRVARRLLLEKDRFTYDKFFRDILQRIDAQVKKSARRYMEINSKMREHALSYKPIDDSMVKERKQLASTIAFGNKVMDLLTKMGVGLLKKKEVTIEQWFEMVKELEIQDRENAERERQYDLENS